jgi:stage V sporulation protein B
MTDELTNITEDSARGGFFLFSGTAIASGILAISTILLGRFLGPELYGQYSLVLVIPSLLVLFTDLGLNAGVIKFVSSLRAENKNEHVPLIIRHGMLIRVGIGLIVSVVGLVFAQYFALLINRPTFTFYIQLASLSIIFQVVFTTSNSAFVGLDKSQYSAFVTTVRAILTTFLQIALVLLAFSVTGALIGYVCGFAVASVVGVVLLVIKFMKPSASLSSSLAKPSSRQVVTSLARYGMPVYVSVVLKGLFPIYQQVVLAFFVTDVAIGNYRAAYNFVMLLSIIDAAITTALLPAFSKLESSKSEVICSFFKKANKYSCLVVVPITTSVIIFSTPIVTLLYGSGYSTAPLYLSLSCSVYLLSFLGLLTMLSMFNGLGKTRLTMYMSLTNFIILLLLSPLLTWLYGVVGALLAYLISSIVATVYAATISVKKFHIQFNFKVTSRIYLISILAGIPALLLLYLTSLNLFLVLAAGALTYLAAFITLMPLFKIVNMAELQTLTRVTDNLPIVKFIARPIFGYQRRILLHFQGSRS